MPRYKKKKHNRFFNPPQKSVKKAKKNSYIDENIESDINGSYTGRPLNGRHPIQDADDL